MIIAAMVGVLLAARAPSGSWVSVPAPGGGVMRAAIARPSGRGPFPVVVVLHGTHGLAEEYVQLGRDLARGGVMAMVPCWFSGSSGRGARFVTPIACPDAPPMPEASSPEALAIVETLVAAARALPDVDGARVGLFGHSRGAGAVLSYILGGGRVRAAVLHSSGYGPQWTERLPGLATPILILHGDADSRADGGTEFTKVERARAFEAAARGAGKDVEAMYSAGGGHNGFFTNPKQRRAETRRTGKFFRRTLR